MGREWYWGGRSSRRLSSSSSSFRFEGDNKNNHHAPAGCMSAVFDFFNFHHSHNLTTAHFIFNKQHHHQQQPSFLSYHEYDPPLPKGVEAPRNSLELDEASLLSLFRKEETLHIPTGLKIKTRSHGGKKSKAREQGRLPNDRFSSESPSAKTPNLVARLMGLDILPQTSSPSSSHHVTPKHGVNHNVSGTRSLPESPRVSSARKSDVDHHRRLSLQINFNKENVGVSEEIEKGKERIRRKGLIDITNTNRNMKLDEEEVGFCPSKSENSSKRLKKAVDDDSSSRLRFLEPLSEILSTTRCTKEKTCHPSFQEVIFEKPIPKPKPKPERKSFREHRQNERRICSKSQQEVEAFVCPAAAATKANINNKINEKSRKKTPLSKDHLLNLNPPTFLSTKKDPKVPHEQPCHFPKGKQKHPTGEEAGERNNATATATDSGVSEFQYIIRILTSNGILMNSPVTKTFSPSNPLSLDPTIFHYLENDAVQDEPMCQNPNKKLIFDLVNELLGDILKTQMKKKKPWEWEEEEDNSIRKMQGWELAEKLWEKTEEFPRANCQVLEDIDALIDRDLTKYKFEFEFISTMEEIVKVVEIEILESLLRETAAIAFMAQPGVVLWSRGPIT